MYLKGRKSFYLLGHSPDTHNSQGWVTAGPGQSQESRTLCGSPVLVAGTQLLEPSPLNPRVHVGWKQS